MNEDLLKNVIKLTKKYFKETSVHSLIVDEYGYILYGDQPSWYCSEVYCNNKKRCREDHKLTLRESKRWAGKYIHLCHKELVLWGLPIIQRGTLVGGVISGFIYFDSFKSEQFNPANSFVGSIKERYLSNKLINHYSQLLLDVFKKDAKFDFSYLTDIQKKVDIQQEIAENIIEKKYTDENFSSTIYKKQNLLLYSIKFLEVADIRENLNNLLSEIYLEGINNLNLLKFRMLELFVIISRTMIEVGGEVDDYYRLTSELIKNTEDMDDLFTFSAWLKERLNEFVDKVIGNRKKQGRMKKVTEYVNQHLNRKISMKEAAAVANLSESRFSYLFKTEVGIPFSEYLLRERIEKSKELLNTGQYGIQDIYLAMNFYDQSYFTKIFKRYTGYTPRAYFYRNNNGEENGNK